MFWHGLGACASGAELVEVAPRLVARGYRPFSVDGPGFGASPATDDYSLAALARQLRGTIAELGLGPVVLMGHSWGGAVVETLAALHPDEPRALVLVDSGHIDYADLPAAANAPDPVTMRWPSREAFNAWLEENLDRATPEVLAGYAEGVHEEGGEIVGTLGEVTKAARAGLLDRLSTGWPRLAGMPTLLLLATKPPHVDQNREHLGRFLEAVPHAEVRWVENASHGLIADVGPPLGDDVAAWLDANAR